MTIPKTASNEPHRFRFRIRTLFVAITLLGLLLMPIAWLDQRFGVPYRQFETINQKIASLELRCPAEMTTQQWETAVEWTHTLYYFNSPNSFQFETAAMSRFEKQLDQKLAGKVDMNTIHWLWDEFAKISPGGQGFQQFRPKMLEDIKKGGANSSN